MKTISSKSIKRDQTIYFILKGKKDKAIVKCNHGYKTILVFNEKIGLTHIKLNQILSFK